MITSLNYHHLRYFREVAVLGHLGQTAERLNVSASALSIQIKQLEERLGYALFDRVGRKLVLTEAGRIALDHADRIFSAGDDLLATLNQSSAQGSPLRVGALSTMSRNFQRQFLQPLFARKTAGVTLVSGSADRLLDDLDALVLDVVLTTQMPRSRSERPYAAQKITEQPAGLHAHPGLLEHSDLKTLLAQAPLILPTESAIRAGFENLIARLGITPHIVANVDDMAMVRLLARDGVGVAVAPAVVLADEIAQGIVTTAPFDLGIIEPFYAVTLPRKFPHPALQDLLGVNAA